jgi:hypothetical protein
MAPDSNDTILVEVESLELVTRLLRALVNNKLQSEDSSVRALAELEQQIRDHKRIMEGPENISLGDIVEPKVGRNTLRAGSTAYGQAVVIEVTPFHMASIDGLHAWGGARVADFVTVGAVDATTLQQLVKKWVD